MMLAPLLIPILFGTRALVRTLTLAGPAGPIADGGTDDAGTVTAGATVSRTYTLSSTGTASVQITGLAYDAALVGRVTGPDVVGGQLAVTLAPGQQTTLTVDVPTSVLGAVGYSLTVASNAAGGPLDWEVDVTVEAATGYVGAYTSANEIRRFRGVKAADVDSNTTGGETAEDPSYQQAIEWGESELDGLAVGLGIAVPMATTAGSPADRTVNRDATILSLWYLYEKRPLEGSTKNRFDSLRDAVLARWAGYRKGVPLPPGFTLVDGSTAAGVLKGGVGGDWPSVDNQGRPTTKTSETRGTRWDPAGGYTRWRW